MYVTARFQTITFRRALPIILITLLAFGVLHGCSGTIDDTQRADAPKVDEPQPSQADMFTLWRSLAHEINSSDAYLPARAKRLIATGDARAIFTFVRDEIQSIPPNSSTEVSRISLYSVPVTLFLGMGNPRDKANLLQWMLEEAGYSATVVHGPLTEPITDLSTSFIKNVRHQTYPDVSAITAQWESLYGSLDEHNLSVVRYSSEFSTYVQRILDEGIIAPPATPYSPGLPIRAFFPEVAVQIDDQEVLLNPTFRDAAFNQSFLEFTSNAVSARDHDVRVTLWARRTSTGSASESVTLLEHTYKSRELVGTAIDVTMASPIELESLLPLQLEQITQFVPSFNVHTLYDSDIVPDDANLDVIGKQFNLQGATFALNSSGTIVQDDTLDINTTPSNANVQQLQIDTLNSAGFPEVVLRVTALDALNSPILDLNQQNFILSENNQTLSKTVTWLTQTQRVVLVTDTSTSMPASFRGTQLDSFVQEIRSGIDAKENTTLSDVIEDPGAQYANLMRGVNQNPSLVVVVSDGIYIDELDAAALESAGVPVVALYVNNGNEAGRATMQEIATLSGGVFYEVSDRPTAVTTIVNAVPQNPSRYEIRYRSPTMSTAEKTVRLNSATSSAMAHTTYVPSGAGVPIGRLVGLYLSVDNGDDSRTHDIAGLSYTQPIEEANVSHADAVYAAMFAQVELAVIPPFVPTLHLMKSWLDHKLTQQGIWDARNDFDALMQAWQSGFIQPNPTLLTVMGTLHDSNDSTLLYPLGASYIVHKTLPSFTQGESEQLDILSLSSLSAAASSSEAAWIATFKTSFRWAIVEASLFNESTYALLHDKPLVSMSLAQLYDSPEHGATWRRLGERFARFYGARFSDYIFLVPQDGDVVAAWVVHESTGMVLGALSDGSGGGKTRDSGKKIERLIRVYEQMDRMFGIFGLDLGFWFKLEVAKAKQVLFATNEIEFLADPQNNPNTINPAVEAEKFGCDTAVGALMGLLPAGDAISRFDAGLQLITEGSATISPCQAIE